MIMGYLPVEAKHYAAITSLVAAANPLVKILDPFAGDGAFLQHAAKAWDLTPYANELDGARAEACIERFGPTQAVRCDALRLVASNNAFGVAWLNPPYDDDKAAIGNRRVEFAMLRHSWKWVQNTGVVLWCVYRQHVTEAAAIFLSKYSSHVDVWALPGKHQGEYDQMVVVAIKQEHPQDNPALYNKIIAERDAPRLLEVQPEPLYKIPPAPPIHRFVFTADIVDPDMGLRFIETQGAWRTAGFQTLLETPTVSVPDEPIVAPRPGHMALVLAAGVANGAVIDSTEHGRVAIRGKIYHVEEIARVETETDPADPTLEIKKTTMRLKPTTVITLLTENGKDIELEGDEKLLGFITSNKAALTQYLNRKFHPLYAFDFGGAGKWLSSLRLNGKYPLYVAQRHVIGALIKGFQERNNILLVGQMGTGKTVMGGAAVIALTSSLLAQMRGQCRPDQVTLIVAPPHLLEKWKREITSLSRYLYVERLDRHEDVKAFMEKAAMLGPNVAKIGLIKRDMTKLGVPHEPAVVWKNVWSPRWQHNGRVPWGMEGQPRLVKERVPRCPTCSSIVMREGSKSQTLVASDSWLRQGKRVCPICHTPLWQEARDKSSQPKAGSILPNKNPRYRLDQYIKRMYPDRIYMLVWDEVHEAQHSDTGNGEAFGRLAGLATKVLAMTGTPFNGRASSIFNLEYAINPRIQQQYYWGGAPRLKRKTRGASFYPDELDDGPTYSRGRAQARWVANMGVLEQVIEERPSFDRYTGTVTGTSTYERPFEEAPGISPLLIAEILDHSIFFSLGDLGKALPKYEEIALPITLDPDIEELYLKTRDQLKDYLIQRRFEGDTSFRGAYLQWSMGWPNAVHRPHDVIHNIRHPITGEKMPHTVVRLESQGEERIYAKEQALLKLLREELAAGRPCIVFVRQTATRDIQPRLEALIQATVPGAMPYILRNTVAADRREAIIDAQVKRGINVIISNPELVKTGLDLVFAPTLIFFEIVFNLGTMMQAAARSYRLNQTYSHCKTYYMFAEKTMEATAVQLMSRKQRAAKLLTGDIGLTGLDELTQGENSLEEALLEAIGHDDSLVDPSQLFADSHTVIDEEDSGYWNVEEEPVIRVERVEIEVEAPTTLFLPETTEEVAPVEILPVTPPVVVVEPVVETRWSVKKFTKSGEAYTQLCLFDFKPLEEPDPLLEAPVV